MKQTDLRALTIATSQFPQSTNIEQNFKYMLRHISIAVNKGANVIHFPELSLSGYQTKTENIDWNIIQNKILKLKHVAKQQKINIVFGVHKKNKNLPPFNSTVVILSNGTIAGEYIKSKLYSAEKKRFSFKENFFTCKINGIICGFLICYDSNFPHLFEKYKKLGVKLLFLSYYNANSTKPKNSMDTLMKSQLITRATDNLFYISGSNSSSYYSRMPSSFVSPDGAITELPRHKPGVLISKYPKNNLGWTIKTES
jgi:deaminated glutathione amidase